MCKRSYSHLLVSIMFFVVIVLVSCNTSPEEALLGLWASDEGTIEFFEDGTVILDGDQVGEYAILDESRLRIGGPATALVVNFEVSGDSLTLSDSESATMFRRGEASPSTNSNDSRVIDVEAGESQNCQGPILEATRVILTDSSGEMRPVPTPQGAEAHCLIEVTRIVHVFTSIDEEIERFIEEQE